MRACIGALPAETDMQEYFRVSPPSVHQMKLTLERFDPGDRTDSSASDRGLT
jgi:hypothetical protein